MIVGGHLQRVHAAHPFYRSAGAPPPAAPASGDRDAPGPAIGPRAADPPVTHAPEPRAAGTANEAEIAGGESLRTALDELAAARHELIAIRDKLHHTREDTRQKLAALEQQAREQRGLLAATGLAVLFVDRELRILHHTPPLQQLIHVWPHDHGRPISDLASCLEYRELAGDLRQVLDTLAPIECEIRDRTGRPFLVRLSPHRSGNEVIGAVATFVDITQVRGTAMQRRAAAR
jgi:two-component system CheB/CheR fusion protein